MQKTVSIIGAGISGCISAIVLSKKFKVNLFEKSNNILNAGPFCHLHAGGFLYPMISLKECQDLLSHSLDFAEMFGDCLVKRPTIIAYNSNDFYNPDDLIKKALFIQSVYKKSNRYFLGPPDDFFNLYTKDDILFYKKYKIFKKQNIHNKYVSTFIDILNDINSIKYPFISVNEPGINLNLIKTKVNDLLNKNSNINVFTNSSVDIYEFNNTWTLNNSFKSDYLINASGFNMKSTNPAFFELKSSWMIKNTIDQTNFPEIAIIGQRETSNGLIQITPHSQDIFQIHLMTCKSTLFENGRVKQSTDNFPIELQTFIKDKCIDKNIIKIRTLKTIQHISKYFSIFKNSTVADKDPLWGIQRIIGQNYDTRASDISVFDNNYIEINIVKGISSVNAANKIYNIIL